MANFSLSESLSNLVKDMKSHYKIKYALPLNLYFGERNETLKKVIDLVAPFSTGVFLSTPSTFEKEEKSYRKMLNGKGVKLINYIVDGTYRFTVEGVSGLFALPDNIRFILYSDKSLSPYASYFAHFRKIPVIYIPNSLDFSNAFNNIISIVNGEKLDYVKVKPQREVIIDKEYIGEVGIAHAFADLMSLLPTLTDYRINCNILNIKPDVYAYDHLKECLTEGYKIASMPKKSRAEMFLYYSIKKALIGGNALDAFTFVSAVYAVESIFSLRDECYEQLRLQSVIDLVNIYSVCFETGSVLQVANLNERAEELAKQTGIDESHFMSNLIYQQAVLTGKTERVEKLKEFLKREFSTASKTGESIYKIYLSLGGKKADSKAFKEIFYTVLRAGDFGRKINGMTIVRESGLTEKYLNGDKF